MAREQEVPRLEALIGRTVQRMLRNQNEAARDIKNRAQVDAKGDLLATGGYRFMVVFAIANIPASATTELSYVTSNTARFVALRQGSIVGIVHDLSVAAAGSALRIDVLRNGSVIHTARIATGDRTYTSELAREKYNFFHTDALTVQVVTDGSWTATTSDISTYLEVEM